MSLRIWLPLNGDLHNQGASDIDATTVGGVINSSGKIGSCYYLSSSSRIYTDLFTPDSNNFSMCCWYKAEEENTSSGYIFGLSRGSSPSFMLYKSSTTVFRLYINSYSSYTHQLDLTQWHHLTITYDGTAYKLYIDGEYKAQRAQTTDYTINSYRCFINCRSNNSNTNGAATGYSGNNYYNDFRYYDHCLSPLEVKEIAQGLVLHYKLDDITNGIIQDSSGYNNNGTITGIPVISTDTVRYSHSLYLETTNTNNHIDGGQLPSTIQTISFWHKNNGSATSYVVFAEPSSGLMFGPAGNYAVVQVSTSSKTCYAITAPYYTNGDWNHIVVQKDGDNYKLWTNGVLRGSSGSNYYRHTGSNLWLFKRNYNNNYTTDSNISDFRAYTTLLSESDIKQLYEVGAKIDNLQNTHTFEYIEDQSLIKVTKQGQIKCDEVIEDTNVEIKKDNTIEAFKFIEF